MPLSTIDLVRSAHARGAVSVRTQTAVAAAGVARACACSARAARGGRGAPSDVQRSANEFHDRVIRAREISLAMGLARCAFIGDHELILRSARNGAPEGPTDRPFAQV